METNTQSSAPNTGFKDLSLNSFSDTAKPLDQPISDLNSQSAALNAQISLSNGINGDKSPGAEAISTSLPTPLPSQTDGPPDDVDTVMTSDPLIAEESITRSVEDPAVQQPTSDLREAAEPATTQAASDIKEEKQQQDLAADRELANGLAKSDNLPIERRLESELLSTGDDMMDITVPVDAKPESGPLDLPHHPATPLPAPELPAPETLVASASTPATESKQPPTPPAIKEPPSQDSIMQDVPASPSKISRSREDESMDDEPATKRFRTGDDGAAVPEFKVPDAPVPQADSTTSAPAPTPSVSANPNQMPAPAEREHNPDRVLPITKPQHKHLTKAVSSMKKGKDAGPFNQPVDAVALGIPNYPQIITKPMDLKTMENKLKANEYVTVAELIADFDQIVWNTTTFNGPDHMVTQNALNLKKSLDRQLSNLPSHDIQEPSPAEKKSKKASVPKPPRRESRSSFGTAKSPPAAVAASPSPAFALNQGMPLIRRDSTVGDGRPRREIHPPPPKDLPYSIQKPVKKKYQWELKFCQEVLNEFRKPKYAGCNWPFLVPVDPVALNIPSYHKIIKKPMDLSTIENKLKSNQYENAKEFESDVRLMVNNCYKFNPADDPVHRAGKQLEQLFDDKWNTMKQWVTDHTPSSGAQTPGSSPEPDDDEEEEEEEEEDEPDDQLSILQKQIAAMSKQVEMIQKKKASPPAASKKAKGAKAVKKETKKATPKADKKDTKAGKKKIPYVTYEQKQYISQRINTLPETRMATALSIIRDNMPSLKSTQEEEIELDIDELSNEVLYKLLTFVRRYAPHPNDTPEPRTPVAAPAAASRPKKNKPMSKTEQEAKIQELKGKLTGSKGASAAVGSPEDYSQAQAEDTSGDEDSDESEED